MRALFVHHFFNIFQIQVRLDILTGLRHLISGNLDNVENRTVIAR